MVGMAQPGTFVETLRVSTGTDLVPPSPLLKQIKAGMAQPGTAWKFFELPVGTCLVTPQLGYCLYAGMAQLGKAMDC
jgi:hypothetical protein